ncbi:MAG TPA: hypothetical protein VIT41_00255, partial [Microlunatus sp.]
MPGLLAKLVHRSLLTVTHEDGGQARFAQLAPVRAHAFRSLRSADEVELAENLRDDWCLALALSRPRLGRVEEADWYAELDDNLATVRATLQRRLVVRPDAVGAAINSATHHQARRVGKPWPRNPLTSELLDRCRVTLSTEQFEHAWAIGPTL